jgi:hypothetical protein
MWLLDKPVAKHVVELQRKRHALTVKALDEADTGQLLDHEVIESWAATVTGPRGRRRRRSRES